jgi:galactosamine-6-phosphate isomerase
MIVERFKDYAGLSSYASDIVLSEIHKKNDSLLCAATGNSPVGLYEQLVRKSLGNGNLSKDLRIIGLDEWGKVPANHPITCEHFLKTNLITPLGIPAERTILFNTDPNHPFEECNRIQSELDSQGPIDICILGLGKNGHLGFNEPGPFLEPYTHVADLSVESMQHSMLDSSNIQPAYGLTLGIKDILSSRKIVLLITGNHKSSVTEDLLEGKITPNLPASFLWLHENVDCLIDENIFSAE